MDIGKDRLLWMYERMRLIRQFEERLHQDFAAGKIPGFVHLYAGEEAVAVGACAHLRDDDFITSTHRGHGHCIAKGVNIREMMAEIYGKSGGASNQGTTLEGLNLAGVWKLPVVFICENNRYAETTSTDYSVSGRDIAARE